MNNMYLIMPERIPRSYMILKMIKKGSLCLTENLIPFGILIKLCLKSLEIIFFIFLGVDIFGNVGIIPLPIHIAD